MKYKIHVLALSINALLGCGNSKSPHNPNAETNAVVENEQDYKKTEMESFDSFFDKFSSDSAYQQNRIIYPLHILINGYIYDEKDSIALIKRGEWKYIDFHDTKNYVLSIQNKTENYAEVLLRGNDTGVYLKYTFKREEEFWFLYDLEDSSN